MTLEPHPHIKYAASEFELMADGTIQNIVAIYTDLELSNIQPDFDVKAWEDLIGHIQAWQKQHNQQVRLRKAWLNAPWS